MWRLRQANTHSDSFEGHIDSDYPKDLNFIHPWATTYLYERKITAIFTIN